MSAPLPPLQVIRKSAFTSLPWKNGGGVTHEAIRVPPSAQDYRWRVSVAHIDASGPFSDFAAYHRKMLLLKGAGIELRFADGSRKTLRQAGDLVEFDGALATYCELLQGPCVDLNLMVSKAGSAAVRVERVSAPLLLDAAGPDTTLVFPIEAAVNLLTDRGERVTLGAWDLAVLQDGACRLEGPDASPGGAVTSVFIASLKFVSG